MSYTTLLSAHTLHSHINHANWVIIDCRFSLANSSTGPSAYRMGHLPHARYAHLDQDLSSTITDLTGRHPLPNFKVLAQKLGAWGISNDTQVVAYDDAGGVFAGRLWWLLRCLGDDKVAVLDGGLKQWQQHYGLTTQLPKVEKTIFRAYLDTNQWLNATQVQNKLAQHTICLIDARTPERFRGEQEPIDPIAGHIPHALNRAFQLNLDKAGLFLPAQTLKQQFNQLIGKTSPEHVVHYCGSGVTACHNLLAMEYAGLTGSKLYAGSWSEWIRNKNRTVATGQ